MDTRRWRAPLSCLAAGFVASTGIAIPPGMTEEERERLNQAAGGDSVVASTAPPLNVSLMSQVLPQQFSTNSTCAMNSTNVCANDVWAYVSPSGREYAILGLRTGTGFVDITDPYNPVIVGAIPDATSWWSDMKTYGAYAYNVTEGSGGMQIISLAEIDPPTRQVTLVGALTQNGLSKSHTLALNEASGFAYLSGSNLGGGRLVAVSLANPTVPTIVGQMNEGVYVHAAQIVTYTSGVYAGREIAFCYCGGQGLKIVDVTNKSNMFTMSTFTYPTLDYCHQGELTNDRRHVVIDDEFDEDSGLVPTTTTYVANVENLNSPYLVTSFTNGQPAIDHNQMVRGDFTFQANYTTGLRVYNISNVNNAQEVGYYDTYPYNNSKSMNGAWGAHATLPSGTILVSDMHAGLFAFDVSEILGPSCLPPAAPEVEPTVARNRYLTVTPGEPGVKTALRVTLVDMPPPFEGLEGTHRWVDAPTLVHDATIPPTPYMVAQLRCTPTFVDWGAVGVVHIADEAIVPGGRYRIDAIRSLCARSVAANFSPASPDISTSLVWADVIGAKTTAPDGQVNALDVVAIVNKFRQAAGAPSMPEADLFPDQPDYIVNALDVTVAVDAFRGFGYPFPGPAPCP